jgi:hypothetical protein
VEELLLKRSRNGDGGDVLNHSRGSKAPHELDGQDDGHEVEFEDREGSF